MNLKPTLAEQVGEALRDHGITAAIGVWFTFIAGLAAAVKVSVPQWSGSAATVPNP